MPHYINKQYFTASNKKVKAVKLLDVDHKVSVTINKGYDHVPFINTLPWARGKRTSLICDLGQTYPSGAGGLIWQVITPLCSIGSSHTQD